MMFVTKQARSLAIFSAILLFEIILVSRAAGQTPGRSEAKTITLGIVAETNQKEIEAHFQDFVALSGEKTFLRDRRSKEGSLSLRPSLGSPTFFRRGRPISTWRALIRRI